MSPDLAGEWSGTGICNDFLVRASLTLVATSDSELKGDMSIEPGFSDLNITISGVTRTSFHIQQSASGILPFTRLITPGTGLFGTGGRYQTVYTRMPFISTVGDVYRTNIDAVVMLLMAPSTQCTRLYFIRLKHEIRTGNESFQSVCIHSLLPWFRESAMEAETAESLKNTHSDLLSSYNTGPALILSLVDEETSRRSLGRSFSDLQIEQQMAIADHLQVCIRYSNARKDFREIARPLWPTIISDWENQLPDGIAHRFAYQPQIGITANALRDALRRASSTSLWLAIKADMDTIAKLPDSRETVDRITTMVRQRSSDLSNLPPRLVNGYLEGVFTRLEMINIAAKLQDEFRLLNIPRLPAPNEEALRMQPDDFFLKPLTDEQYDELTRNGLQR